MSNANSGNVFKFGFEKKPSTISLPTKTNGEINSLNDASLQRVPGRKRIQVMNDSESESDHPKTPKKFELSIKDKEDRLIASKRLFPDHDTMIIQDALVHNNWDVHKAGEILRKTPTRPHSHKRTHSRHSNGVSPSNDTSSRSKKQKTQNGKESDSDDDSKIKKKVFDSDDDSDREVSNFMTKDRKHVFEFMNNASMNELLAIRACSIKKIDSILELRPFKSWGDLVKKISNSKHLSADLLNSCQDLLVRRQNLVKIMKKCNTLVQRLETAVAAGGGVVKQPSNLNPICKLAEYQMVGLNWLAVLHKEETNGILADEMGLGKTIQVIAFLAYLKQSGYSKYPHLIVVPSSTLSNWDNEMAKWCPDLNVAKYYGSQDERKQIRIKWAKYGLKGTDVILTTYHTVGSTPEERKMFRVTQIHYVIFDEAHMLKNMVTQRYANLIRINALRRILLTGTPLQNNLLELMSLLCFVMPSLFSKSTDDIKNLFQKNKGPKTSNKEEVTTFEQSQIIQAKRIMKPFVLRRLKKDVLKYLPKKSEKIIKLDLTVSQKEKYMQLVKSYSSESGIVKATTDQSGIAMMMNMRKLALHPLLLRYYYSDDDVRKMAKFLSRDPLYKKDNPDYIFEELAYLSDFQLFQLTKKHQSLGRSFKIPNELILESGKFKILDDLLLELKNKGHRVLIFSQFTMMLDVLETYLDIREHQYLRLDGQTQVTERQDLIDKYSEDSDYFIFLLSTRAGGLGINLTSADTVIIHDIDFNPYNDKQAEDRCHRMGQTKPVTIYKLIANGTIEEGILMVAKEKLNLEREVTSEGNEEQEEHKCMVRLLTMSLGMDANRAESLLSPSPKKGQTLKNKDNDDLI